MANVPPLPNTKQLLLEHPAFLTTYYGDPAFKEYMQALEERKLTELNAFARAVVNHYWADFNRLSPSDGAGGSGSSARPVNQSNQLTNQARKSLVLDKPAFCDLDELEGKPREIATKLAELERLWPRYFESWEKAYNQQLTDAQKVSLIIGRFKGTVALWIDGLGADELRSVGHFFAAIKRAYARDVNLEMFAAMDLVSLKQEGNVFALRGQVASLMAIMKQDRQARVEDSLLLKALLISKLDLPLKQHVMAPAKWDEKTLTELWNMVANFESARKLGVVDSPGWGRTTAEVNAVYRSPSKGPSQGYSQGYSRGQGSGKSNKYLDKDRACYICGSYDHLMRDCEYRHKAKQARVALVKYITVGLATGSLDEGVKKSDLKGVAQINMIQQLCEVCGTHPYDTDCNWLEACEDTGMSLLEQVAEQEYAQVGYHNVKLLDSKGVQT